MVYRTAPFSMTLNDPLTWFSRLRHSDVKYLTNGYRYGHSYYTLWFKKNAPTLADYNCDPVQSILIIFSKLFVNDHKKYDFLLIGHCKYSCMLYHFQVILRWIIVTLKRSLKVIQTGTIRKLGCGFLFAFHSNYGRVFNRLWDSSSKYTVTLKTGFGVVQVIETGAVRYTTTFYLSAIVNIALSCTVFELFDVE